MHSTLAHSRHDKRSHHRTEGTGPGVKAGRAKSKRRHIEPLTLAEGIVILIALIMLASVGFGVVAV